MLALKFHIYVYLGIKTGIDKSTRKEDPNQSWNSINNAEISENGCEPI